MYYLLEYDAFIAQLWVDQTLQASTAPPRLEQVAGRKKMNRLVFITRDMRMKQIIRTTRPASEQSSSKGRETQIQGAHIGTSQNTHCADLTAQDNMGGRFPQIGGEIG